MPYSAAAVKRYLCVVISLSLVVGFAFSGHIAQAASTQVDALVCGGANGATITINEPASDSVVNHPAVTVKGDVTNSTQIDVSVDDNYNSTIPLDAHQTTYEFDVNLSQGTHTIKLVANDVCQTQDATASVVVTFQPQTQPGDGGSTPTTTGGGVTIGGPPQTGVEPVNNGLSLSHVPVVGTVFNFFVWIGHTLDFDTAGEQGLLMAVLRFAMIIGGLLLLVFGSALFEFIMLIPWFKHHRVQRIRNMSHWRGWHGWALHLFGLILFLAAFVI